jgi:hypothetical protein
LLEAAIVLPVLIVLLGGIFELGFTFRSASVTASSTRSGARLAAALYGSTASGSDRNTVLDQVRQTVEKDLSARDATDTPQVLWVYRVDSASAKGQPVGSTNFSSCSTDCVQFSWDGSHFTPSSGSGSWSAPDACGRTLDEVGVYVRLRHRPAVFPVLGAKTINEMTAMRLEPNVSCLTE